MKRYTTAQRLKQIMAQRGLRQVDILRAAAPYCNELGCSLKKNAISQYVSGKVEPRQDKLTILGLALGVSEAWLMGYDVPIECETEFSEDDDRRKKEVLRLFRLLSHAEQVRLLRTLQEWLEQELR
ncbi:MAG: transcriptional regulator [Oscillospiraceae bacterium]|nr:transcriptional regulator [Oscillospiraceae bacterium]